MSGMLLMLQKAGLNPLFGSISSGTGLDEKPGAGPSEALPPRVLGTRDDPAEGARSHARRELADRVRVIGRGLFSKILAPGGIEARIASVEAARLAARSTCSRRE